MSGAIGLLDTSIFVAIVGVPTKDDNRAEVLEEMGELIKDGTTLLLPMTAILETGNHIGQNGKGGQKRMAAERFVKLVRQAIQGEAPWSISNPPFDSVAIDQYLDEFPDSAMRGVGFGDLSIIKEFERHCALNAGRRVFIWTRDEHLRGYDRPPQI